MGREWISLPEGIVDREASEALRQFRSAVEDLRHQPDPYVLRELANRLEAFRKGSARMGLSEPFIQSMQESFVEAFRRLDALPRDDRFWDRTNRRPTQHKLRSFCQRALEEALDPIPALRMMAAVEVVLCLAFNPRTWMRLHEATQLEIGWPIYAALLGEDHGRSYTVPAILGLLAEIDPAFQARSELAWMVLSDDPQVSKWAGRVREGLRQRTREPKG
jgi:hypothetical protein